MPETFTISSKFSTAESEIIAEALKKSIRLPEGVNVVRWNEIGQAVKPFVVIAHSMPDTRAAYKAGALNYITYTVDIEELAARLDK